MAKVLKRRFCTSFEQDGQGELLPSLVSVHRHVRLWSDYFLRWSPAPSFLPLPASIRGMRLATGYTWYLVHFIFLSALLLLFLVWAVSLPTRSRRLGISWISWIDWIGILELLIATCGNSGDFCIFVSDWRVCGWKRCVSLKNAVSAYFTQVF